MGTTLANLHILNGDAEQIGALLPKATVGCWSERFVSAYSEAFAPDFGAKAAKSLSKKLEQPVLLAWLFDSDAVGLAIFQGGKQITEHILHPEGYNKMGNIPLFCEALGLSAEDVPRLRTVWKKGDAEEQLELTALLLGLPLYHDHNMIPDKQHNRDVEAVDTWISERPAPQKVKNETTALLLQEIPCFQWSYINSVKQICSVDSSNDEFDLFTFWKPDANGTLIPNQTTESDTHDNSLRYRFPDGGQLMQTQSKKGTTFTRRAKDGTKLWSRSVQNQQRLEFFGYENGEVIFTTDGLETSQLERVDSLTGTVIDTIPKPFGLNAWSKVYSGGYWWVAHDGNMPNSGHWQSHKNALVKLDGTFQIIDEIPLPTFTQTLFFSPDNTTGYAFFFKDRVMVLDTETLAVRNVLFDKSILEPLGFDAAGRFWLRRDHSTAEAWDAALGRTLSRHKLKGEITTHHKTGQGGMCVVTWRKKEETLRVYRFV